ncbi:MAG TPA: META domain-containing protein [Vicinamibacterales bacterium]
MHRSTVLTACSLLLFTLTAGTARAESIEGSATFRERMALPPTAVFEALLEDVSRADAPAETIARTRRTSPGNPPISFTIAYDPARIQSNRTYIVRARILVDDQLWFTTDTATPVITGGHPTKVSLMMRRVDAGQTPPPTAGGQKPLEGTYWRATELGGKPAPPQDPTRETHLEFHAGRVSGSDGCNLLTGSYHLNGDRVTFSQMAGTQMACINPEGTEGPFRDALNRGSRMTVTGDRLELFDAGGKRLAAFVAANRPSDKPPDKPSDTKAVTGFAGTSWQLVKFQSMDDTTLKPDDRSKYTIEFQARGRLAVRIDCNRGTGTWKSAGPSQMEFGPLALTRAQCPPGSLHDQIVKQWPNIRSYVVRDGHLFLALKLDSGIYEFEPFDKGK